MCVPVQYIFSHTVYLHTAGRRRTSGSKYVRMRRSSYDTVPVKYRKHFRFLSDYQCHPTRSSPFLPCLNTSLLSIIKSSLLIFLFYTTWLVSIVRSFLVNFHFMMLLEGCSVSSSLSPSLLQHLFCGDERSKLFLSFEWSYAELILRMKTSCYAVV